MVKKKTRAQKKKSDKKRRSTTQKDSTNLRKPMKKVKKDANKFRREVKRHIVTGITAAFGFLIALTWREPIADLVNMLVENFDIQNEILFKFITAIIMTLIAALVLMYLTRWAAKDEDKKEAEKTKDTKKKGKE